MRFIVFFRAVQRANDAAVIFVPALDCYCHFELDAHIAITFEINLFQCQLIMMGLLKGY